jgi:ribonuclease HI
MKVFRKGILYAYTDGSSLNKPRRGGMGIRFIYLDENEEEHYIDVEPDGVRNATNNVAELLACIEALKRINNLSLPFKPHGIEIRTDSRYVVNNVDYAKYTWPQQKWHNKLGRPIENMDLWKELVKQIRQSWCRVDFEWVKGHKNDPHNKAADNIADKSSHGYQAKPISVITVRRRKSTEKTKVGSVIASGQRIAVRIISSQSLKRQGVIKYRYEVISPGSKYYNKVDLAFSELILRDGHSYIVTMNSTPGNPRFLNLIKEIINE